MRPPLHISHRPSPLAGLPVAVALLLSGCGGTSPADNSGENAVKGRKVPAALEWRSGDEHSFIAHRFDQEVIRCWNVQGKYDCLVAQSIGLKDIIPGAPARLAFFRFRADALPEAQKDVDGLASSDGYACELTSLPGKTVMTESYWRAGRVVHDQASDMGSPGGWTAADIARFDAEGRTNRTRPFFACAPVIAPVLDVGLYALDSGLVSYDQIFSAVDYPIRPKAAPQSDQSGDVSEASTLP